ncbi:MAG: hypothetical protein Q9227_008662 [Pyrenula ochraceoflavens]
MADEQETFVNSPLDQAPITPPRPNTVVPRAKSLNGTYHGVHNSHYYQDLFLGVPFAQAPVGDLRLRAPRSLNTTWSERSGTEYGYSCIGYGEDTAIGGHDYVSEDCLTLNIVRPAGYERQKLPVSVWIYGGGFFEGTSLDPRYNLSYIVEQSVIINQPIIGISINYRLSGWGFLFSQDLVAEHATNLGLRDQRLALQWIQENISGFGGNPDSVTIWGESAGALSVGYHLLAYGGREDNLFHAAISESGPIYGEALLLPTAESSELKYQSIICAANCTNYPNGALACLRSLSTEKYNAILNTTSFAAGYGPQPDNDLLPLPAAVALSRGAFKQVPYLIGDNSDEGTAFTAPGLNSDSDLISWLSSSFRLSPSTINTLLALYPNEPSSSLLPHSHPSNFNTTIGTHFKRAATIITDLAFVGPRRLITENWLQHTDPKRASLYTYRFNTIPNGIPDHLAATHFQEIPFVFHLTRGRGYPDVDPPYYGPDPFAGKPKSYFELADSMARLWASFIHNAGRKVGYEEQGVPEWPVYDGAERGQMVFDAEGGVGVERDVFREEQIGRVMEMYREGIFEGRSG